MTSSPIPAARGQYLLGLLAQIPDPRKKRGRRHPLAGLLATGIAAVITGSRSFAAIGQWAADAGPEVLAGLGAARGPAEESTFRRAFAMMDPGRLGQVLGAWLHTRAVQVKGRLVIAIDGKAVRGARDKDGKAPHLAAALAHGTGAVLGQVAEAAANMSVLSTQLLRDGMDDPGPLGVRARQRAEEQIQATKSAEYFSLDLVLGYRYRHSPVIPDEPEVARPVGTRPADDWVTTARAGRRLPHLWVRPDVSTLDLAGPGYTALAARSADIDPLVGAARERRIPLAVRQHGDDLAGRLGASLVIVRPDHIVAWAGETVPAEAAALLDRVTGRIPAQT